MQLEKEIDMKDLCKKEDAIIIPVRTEEQRKHMYEEIQYGYFSKTWTGVKKKDGEWKNPDGSPVPDEVWASNEPNEDGDCGYISSRVEYKLIARKCKDVIGLLICEKKDRDRKRETTTTTEATTTTTTEATTPTTEATTPTTEATTTTTKATTTTTEATTTTMEPTTTEAITTTTTPVVTTTTTAAPTTTTTTPAPTTTTTTLAPTTTTTTPAPTTTTPAPTTTTPAPTTTTPAPTTATTPAPTTTTTTPAPTTTTTTPAPTTTTTPAPTTTTTPAPTTTTPAPTTTTPAPTTTTTTPAPTTTTSAPTTSPAPTTTTQESTTVVELDLDVEVGTTTTTTTLVPTTTTTSTTTLAPTTTTTTTPVPTTTTTSTTVPSTTTPTTTTTTTPVPTTTTTISTTTTTPETTTTESTTVTSTSTEPTATTTTMTTTTTTPVPTTTSSTTVPTTTSTAATTSTTSTTTTTPVPTTSSSTTVPMTTSTTTEATTSTTTTPSTTSTALPTTTPSTTTTTEPTTTPSTTTTTEPSTTSSTTTTTEPTTISSTTTMTEPTTTSSTTTTTEPTTTSSTTVTIEPTTTPSTTTTTKPTTTTTEETTTTPMPTTSSSTTTTTTVKSTSTTPEVTTLPTTTTTTEESTTEPTTTSSTEVTTPEPESNKSCSSYSKSTDYYWPNMKFNGTTVTDDSPEFTNGPLGFGWGVTMEGNEKDTKKCLKFTNFGKNEDEDKCWNNPSECKDGISFSIWEKIKFPKKSDTAKYILSTGGDDKGTPGIALYYKGIYIYAVVSTGDSTWYIEAPGPISNDTWSNIGIRWDKTTGLEMDVNAERVAFVKYPEKTTPRKPIEPFELTTGCRRTENNEYVDFSSGSFDEIAVWMEKLSQDSAECFLGGYDGKNKCDPETHPLHCETDLANVIAILEDLKLTDPKVFKEVVEHLHRLASTKPEPEELETTTEKPDNTTTTEPVFKEVLKNSEEEIKKCQDLEIFIQIMYMVMDKTSDDLTANQNKTVKELESMLSLQHVLSHLMTEDLAESCEPTKVQELCKLAKDTEKWSLKQMQTTFYSDSSTCITISAETMICESMTIMSGLMKREYDSAFPFPGDCGEKSEESEEDENTQPLVMIPVEICGSIPAGVRLYFQMCRYFTLHKICPTTNSATGKDDSLMRIDSNPISILVHPDYSPSALEDSQIVYLAEHKQKKPATGRKLLAIEVADEDKEITQRYCMRWKDSQTIKGNEEKGGWSDEDCKIVNSSAESTTCSCQAPGSYAVMARFRKPFDIPPEPDWLKILKWVGHGISLILLLFYIFSIACSVPLHEQFHTIRLNLAIAAIGALSSFVLSDFMRDDEEICRILSATNHYLYTAVSSWFLMEANALFSAIVSGVVSGRVFMYLLLGWGLPGIAVGISYVLYPDYGYDYRCMVGPNNEMRIVLIGSILAPTTVAFLWSLLTMCNIGTPVIKKTAVVNEISSGAKAHFVVNILFMATWVCAVFTYIDLRLDELPSFNPIFQVMNSCLGIFIVIIMGFGSRHFRSSICRRKKDGISVKQGLDPFEYNDNAVVDKYRKTFSA